MRFPPRLPPPALNLLSPAFEYQNIFACERILWVTYAGWLDSTSSSSSSTQTQNQTESNDSDLNDPTLNSFDTSSSIGPQNTYKDAVGVVEGVCGAGFCTRQGRGSFSVIA
ncbi:hypothetical protein D9758_012539 [Tetrapyrgos nigripes]|uniref:Uncharacterized protein n=1 Tax=Tetrapyrgos nigripes TaxID=182062 RepID=A0A8H5G348_9AGAR|nr:hypothetical protein D9758_012539 [Tetrapyrgos nigripes]